VLNMMKIANLLRLISLALYMTDPGRVAFDPTLVNEYTAALPAVGPSVS
jgi:hypothetical protein